MMSRLKITGLSAIIALLVVAGYLFLGGYNVAADNPHWTVTKSLLSLIRDRSVEVRTDNISLPGDLDSEARIKKGADLYDEMCVDCHLAPGIQDSVLHEGLYPQPPKLANDKGLEPREAFYIITHGLKMTAMPAWGKSHNKDLIWDMVAFLRKLPGMTPEQYKQMTASEHSTSHAHNDDHQDHHLRCGGD